MSTEAPVAAAPGPLSVDQAVAALNATAPDETVVAAEPVEQEEEEQPLEQSEAEPTAEENPDPEEAIEGEQEVEPESDPDAPVIAAPTSWDATERAEFAKLPAAAKQIIAAREAERDKAVSRAQTEASEAKKAAHQEVEQLTQLKGTLEQILPRAEKMFADQWANVDWEAWAQQDPAAAQAGFFRFQREQAQLSALQTANQRTAEAQQRKLQADQAEHQRKFIADESEKLKSLAPDLVDPVKGSERKQAVAQYLIGQGIEPQSLGTLPATALSIAWKAYQFDQLKAGVAKAPQLKAKPASASAPVRPTSAAPVRTPQLAAQQLSNRFTQTGSVDDAVALLNARSARKAS